MKYTVIKTDCGQTIDAWPGLSKKQAITTAVNTASTCLGYELIFISWHRKSDGQTGYLNPDGNHDITGKAW